MRRPGGGLPGSHASCVDGGYPACGPAQYGPAYSTALRCDGVDHACTGVPPGTVTCDGHCCPTGSECAGVGCAPFGAAGCQDNSDCQNDALCLDGGCVPWTDGGFDPGCVHPAQPAHFSPSIRCAWPPAAGDGGYLASPDPEHVQVITTPLVADFQLYPGPHPMVVFPTQNSLGGGTDEDVGNATAYGLLRILDPQTCTIVATLDAADQHIVGSSTPAIGDLNGDGRPDIVAAAVGGGLVAFTYDAATQSWVTLWHSTEADGSPSTLNANTGTWAGPSIADVNGDGRPEVVFGGVIHDHTGRILGRAPGCWRYSAGQIPVLANVDLDGGPELLTGNRLLTFNPATTDWVDAPYFVGTGLTDGFTGGGAVRILPGLWPTGSRVPADRGGLERIRAGADHRRARRLWTLRAAELGRRRAPDRG